MKYTFSCPKCTKDVKLKMSYDMPYDNDGPHELIIVQCRHCDAMISGNGKGWKLFDPSDLDGMETELRRRLEASMEMAGVLRPKPIFYAPEGNLSVTSGSLILHKDELFRFVHTLPTDRMLRFGLAMGHLVELLAQRSNSEATDTSLY